MTPDANLNPQEEVKSTRNGKYLGLDYTYFSVISSLNFEKTFV